MFILCGLLASCQVQSDKFTSATGITPGQSLELAGQLLNAYQGKRMANATAAKVAVNVQPGLNAEFEAGTVREVPWWELSWNLIKGAF